MLSENSKPYQLDDDIVFVFLIVFLSWFYCIFCIEHYFICYYLSSHFNFYTHVVVIFVFKPMLNVLILKLCMFVVGWLFGFYGISTFVGYLMPNPLLCK